MRLICHHDWLPWKPLTQSLPLDPNSSIDQVVLGYLSPPIKDNGIIFKKGNKLIKNFRPVKHASTLGSPGDYIN